MNDRDLQVREKFVDLGGRSAQRLGLARSLGQIYAALYLNPEPMGLEDLTVVLHISKGSASMSVRQLVEWGAVRQVWIKGDRRDYYEANPDFGIVIRHFLAHLIRPRLDSTGAQLKDLRQCLDKGEGRSSPESEFMRQRMARMEKAQKRIGRVLPLLEKMLP